MCGFSEALSLFSISRRSHSSSSVSPKRQAVAILTCQSFNQSSIILFLNIFDPPLEVIASCEPTGWRLVPVTPVVKVIPTVGAVFSSHPAAVVLLRVHINRFQHYLSHFLLTDLATNRLCSLSSQ